MDPERPGVLRMKAGGRVKRTSRADRTQPNAVEDGFPICADKAGQRGEREAPDSADENYNCFFTSDFDM